MSKKGAESLSALVLDVKFGRAALYRDLPGAKELAQLLVSPPGVGILGNHADPVVDDR